MHFQWTEKKTTNWILSLLGLPFTCDRGLGLGFAFLFGAGWISSSAAAERLFSAGWVGGPESRHKEYSTNNINWQVSRWTFSKYDRF